jgi:hypothetical protein
LSNPHATPQSFSIRPRRRVRRPRLAANDRGYTCRRCLRRGRLRKLPSPAHRAIRIGSPCPCDRRTSDVLPPSPRSLVAACAPASDTQKSRPHGEGGSRRASASDVCQRKLRSCIWP